MKERLRRLASEACLCPVAFYVTVAFVAAGLVTASLYFCFYDKITLYLLNWKSSP